MWALIYRVYLAHRSDSSWVVRRLVRQSAPLFESILEALEEYLGGRNPLSTLIETHKVLSCYPHNVGSLANVLGAVEIYHSHILDLFSPIAVVDHLEYCAISLAVTHETKMMRLTFRTSSIDIPFSPDYITWQKCHEYLLTGRYSGVHPISGEIIRMGESVEDGSDTIRVSKGLRHKGIWFVLRDGFFIPTIFLHDQEEIEDYMKKELNLVETLKTI